MKHAWWLSDEGGYVGFEAEFSAPDPYLTPMILDDCAAPADYLLRIATAPERVLQVQVNRTTREPEMADVDLEFEIQMDDPAIGALVNDLDEDDITRFRWIPHQFQSFQEIIPEQETPSKPTNPIAAEAAPMTTVPRIATDL